MSDELEQLLDIKEAAKLLNVSETSLRRWTNSGALKAYRVGGRRERRFRRADLFDFLLLQHAESATANAVSEGSTPSTKSLGRQHTAHFGALYSSDEGLTRLAANFLRPCLTGDSAAFLVAEPRARRAILQAAVAPLPTDERTAQARRVVASDYRDTVHKQLRYWERSLEQALADGAKSICIIGDCTSLIRKKSPDECLLYEAEYDRLIAQRYPVRTLCLYDVRQLQAVDVLKVLHAHRDNYSQPVQMLLA